MRPVRTPGGEGPAPGLLFRVSRQTLVLALVAGSACASPPAGDGGVARRATESPSGAEVRFLFASPRGGARSELEVEFADGRRTRVVRSAEFRTVEEVPTPHSPWFPTADQGLLRLRIALSGSSGAALAGGTMELPLLANTAYEVSVFTWSPRSGLPYPPCFGCVREIRFPLREDADAGTAEGDSLVVRAVRIDKTRLPPVY